MSTDRHGFVHKAVFPRGGGQHGMMGNILYQEPGIVN